MRNGAVEKPLQAPNGRFLNRCVWCGVACYGKTCRDHRILEDRLREHREGKTKGDAV